jgi:hypothetical protein
MSTSKLFAALALALVGFAGCDDDSTGPSRRQERFVATLQGQNEVPPVTTNTTGTATLTITNDTTISYTITLQNATGITAAHIHVGRPGIVGGVLAGLFSAANPGVNVGSGMLVEGTFTPSKMPKSPPLGLTFEDLKALMRSGGVYVNVHSTSNPAGVVRGQVTRQ